MEIRTRSLKAGKSKSPLLAKAARSGAPEFIQFVQFTQFGMTMRMVQRLEAGDDEAEGEDYQR